ncbi:MAG TPA: transporter substrate-binding domain-containing protein [Micromonosporaceae bacterium]|nr:transporter substrate-binding domain-containing protein [Micromonosporaceae bacterium]
MRRTVAALTAVALAVAVQGCDWPLDADGTLAGVRAGVLRVGVTASPPWVSLSDDSVDGAEARLVERLADGLGARVEWVRGGESELMEALRERVLDLVVGGLDAEAPWTREASLTRPYVRMRTVVAVPDGVPVPADLDGVPVAVEAGTAAEAALADEGARPVPVPEVTGRERTPVVVPEWQVRPLGLRPTGTDLARHDHVWAVPLGENGWQVEVERFLLDLSHDEVARLLAEESAR